MSRQIIYPSPNGKGSDAPPVAAMPLASVPPLKWPKRKRKHQDVPSGGGRCGKTRVTWEDGFFSDMGKTWDVVFFRPNFDMVILWCWIFLCHLRLPYVYLFQVHLKGFGVFCPTNRDTATNCPTNVERTPWHRKGQRLVLPPPKGLKAMVKDVNKQSGGDSGHTVGERLLLLLLSGQQLDWGHLTEIKNPGETLMDCEECFRYMFLNQTFAQCENKNVFCSFIEHLQRYSVVTR